MFTHLWTTLLDLIYPPKCPVCRGAVDSHGAWCGHCLAPVMAAREVSMAEHRLHALDACYVICDYTGGLKRLIHDMKFRRAERYAVQLAWLLEQGVKPKWVVGADTVIPVPLHAARQAERGYNQTERIFKTWTDTQGLCWLDNSMERLRATVPQWELTLAERRKNIKGAFGCTRPELVKDKHIIVVDDIFTSGITMEECAKILKQAGAASVRGLALASGAQ
jgi:ComF family protein